MCIRDSLTAVANKIFGSGGAAFDFSGISNVALSANQIGSSPLWGTNALGLILGSGGDYQAIVGNNCNGASSGHSGTVGSHGFLTSNPGC